MQSYDNYDDDFQDSHHQKNVSNKPIELPKLNNKSIQRSKSKDKNKNNSQYDQQNYDDDFQSPKHKPIQKSIEKTNKSIEKIKQSNQKTKKSQQTQQNVNKIKKSSSTNNNNTLSKQRQNSNKKLSLSTLKNSNIQTQSKYLSYLTNQFSHTRQQILQLPTQKINRLNEKLRTYIKKVNDQLTELINQNMRKFKSNTLKTNPQKTIEDQIRILSEQKKNGQIYLDTVQKQSQNLNEKWQKVKNLQSGPNTDQQISQINIKIKEIAKQINLLKHNVTQQGNKLTEDKNYGQKINQLKNKLSKLKRDQQKNTQKLQKTETRFQQLSSKNPQLDSQLEILTSKAKSENINVNTTVSDKKLLQKFEELKKKVQNQRMHRDKTESLNQTKLNILRRDNEILTNQITQIQRKFNQIDTQITSIKQASVTLIEQAKYQELQPYIQTHLDFIHKNIIQGISNSTNQKIQRKSSTKNVLQEGPKYGIKKYASVVNVRKYQRSQSYIQLKPNFQIHKKSLFDQKAKQKDSLKLQNKQSSERVWNQQIPNQQQKQKPKQMNESTSSKPFIIRKSQNVNTISEGSPKLHKYEASPNLNDQKQNEISTLLAPKMKFKKNEHQDTQLEIQKKQTFITEKNSNELKNNQKDEEPSNSKPAFKIKKTIKQKVQIPEQQLNVFNQVPKKKTEQNLNSHRQTQTIDKIKQDNDPTNQPSIKKGPNFKLFKKSINQPQENNIQQEILQSNRNRSPQNKKQEITSKQEVIEEDLGINGGRRQAGRKIQRKSQDSYVI